MESNSTKRKFHTFHRSNIVFDCRTCFVFIQYFYLLFAWLKSNSNEIWVYKIFLPTTQPTHQLYISIRRARAVCSYLHNRRIYIWIDTILTLKIFDLFYVMWSYVICILQRLVNSCWNETWTFSLPQTTDFKHSISINSIEHYT